jgi:hypothetical protein
MGMTSHDGAAADVVAPGGTLLVIAHDSTNLEHGDAARATRLSSTGRTTWRAT